MCDELGINLVLIDDDVRDAVGSVCRKLYEFEARIKELESEED